METGPNSGNYFYTRDHLGSIRELTDSSGTVRARYAYDPYGRRTKLTGDLEADFGFTGLFFSGEAGIAIARFRAFDAELGRWLSRDPLPKAETQEGPNLYAYVANDPVDNSDALGLTTNPRQRAWEEYLDPSLHRSAPGPEPSAGCCGKLVDDLRDLEHDSDWCQRDLSDLEYSCEHPLHGDPTGENFFCASKIKEQKKHCDRRLERLASGTERLLQCLIKGCTSREPCQQPTGPKDFCIRDPFTGNTTCRLFSQ